MKVRAVRTEPYVAVGPWRRDLEKGNVYDVGDGAGQMPKYVAEYLLDHGAVIEAQAKAKDNPWFDSDDPELAED